MKNINAVFIECNIEQAIEFAKELNKETTLNVFPATIKDLKENNEYIKGILEKVQLIIATFNHVNEVRKLTSNLGKEVLGVAINPSLENIVKIAKYPKGTRFGLICISNEFQFKVESALKSAGLDIDMATTTSRDAYDVKRLLDTSDVIIVSPGRRKEVKALINDDREIISFDYNLDLASVKAIMSKIVELNRI